MAPVFDWLKEETEWPAPDQFHMWRNPILVDATKTLSNGEDCNCHFDSRGKFCALIGSIHNLPMLRE
ncbi:hypothetical protein AWB65_06258 [Caballeronia humi]|uniref:Uncharacterized protein n=1 Tax=Caballeronia humi TaxID=326474 RepID=A0A158JAT8_9BURK|nr:hypothetical protein AWB65_06258 [Caballeronia humi]